MDVLSIPLLFAFGVLGIVLAALGYEMASAWLSYRKALRWSK